jgi:hypothetical protein
VNAKDATTQLWLFGELVKNKPAKGSNDYPVAIKAVHLDENYRRSTLVDPNSTIPNSLLYEVQYDEDGTRIKRIFKDGTNVGDILYWDDEKWTPLRAVSSSTLHILGIKDNELQWVETQDCPE